MRDAYEHHFVKTNGITLHVVMAGPTDGPPVFLLHGFPEFWYGWHNQISFLAAQGYRVIVPDQRGYNLSDKPKGISAYHIDHLAEDIVGLIDALGYEFMPEEHYSMGFIRKVIDQIKQGIHGGVVQSIPEKQLGASSRRVEMVPLSGFQHLCKLPGGLCGPGRCTAYQ